MVNYIKTKFFNKDKGIPIAVVILIIIFTFLFIFLSFNLWRFSGIPKSDPKQTQQPNIEKSVPIKIPTPTPTVTATSEPIKTEKADEVVEPPVIVPESIPNQIIEQPQFIQPQFPQPIPAPVPVPVIPVAPVPIPEIINPQPLPAPVPIPIIVPPSEILPRSPIQLPGVVGDIVERILFIPFNI